MSDKTLPGLEEFAEVEVPERPKVKKRILIYMSADIVLDEKDVWPDGDAPEGWGAQEAQEVIENYGIKRMGLLDDLDIDYTVVDDEGMYYL